MFAGRVADVAGVPGKPDILYVGAASSGLYKSTNGGITFDPVFETGNTLSIGAIAVQPDNPDVVYVGTGEGAVRNSISFGDGIYKTTDGGKSWKHLGLQTERALLAHRHSSDEPADRPRGRDGQGVRPGRRARHLSQHRRRRDVDAHARRQRDDRAPATWRSIRGDPNIVYAGLYDYLRQPWYFRSGGPGSGLYRSADGGVTWKKLTDPALKNGLPGARLVGRVGVSVSRELAEHRLRADRGAGERRAVAVRRSRHRPGASSTASAASTTGRSTTRRCASIPRIRTASTR